MNWKVVCGGKVIGRAMVDRRMTDEEICAIARVELAVTQEDFEGMPENGKYDLGELEIIEE